MKTTALAVLITLASVGRAFAQDPPPADVPPDTPAVAPDTPDVAPPPMPMRDPGYTAYPERNGYDTDRPSFMAEPHLYSGIGLGVLIGGGVSSFFGESATSESKVGADWTARVELGTRSHIGGEFAYLGTTNEITSLGVATHAQLLSNGAQGLLRLNVLTGPIQPYAGVGIGYKRYEVVNTSVNTTDIANRTDLPSVPAAAGIAFRGMGLIIDTRFAIDAPISASVIPGSAMTSWNLGANIGAEF